MKIVIGGKQWNSYTTGGARIVSGDDGSLRFALDGVTPGRYADAQLDDYQGLPRRSFAGRPPVSVALRARFSHPGGQLKGTAGFGFWNDPFAMTGGRLPALPRAVWFFYASPPSNMALALDTPGYGWKAATLDTLRPTALAVAPAAALLVSLMNVPAFYRRVWPGIQRALAIAEQSLAARATLTEWHAYRLDWLPDVARFWVDGEIVLEASPPPGGPLGFVMWLDNQYMVATPQGRFMWGVVDMPEAQWMEVADFSFEAG